MQRSKCEFYAETQAKAEAKLNEWKKTNARAVSIVAQIIEMPSADSAACVIRVEYESSDQVGCSLTDQGDGKRRARCR